MFHLLADATGFVSQLDGKEVIIIVALSGGALVAITALFAHAWQRATQTDHRARLAALLVQRGLPTAEIERIMHATQLKGDAPAIDPLEDPEVQLVKTLTENHYDGKDVQLVLEAARAGGTLDAAVVGMVRSMSENWVDAAGIAEVIRKRRTRDPKLAITA